LKLRCDDGDARMENTGIVIHIAGKERIDWVCEQSNIDIRWWIKIKNKISTFFNRHHRLPSSKKPKAPSFPIGSGWNLADMFFTKFRNAPLFAKSNFRVDVTLSRWRPRRHFRQQSAATWLIKTKCLPAPMQQRRSVPDL